MSLKSDTDFNVASYLIYYQEQTNETETMKRKLTEANQKIARLEERIQTVEVNH